MHASQKSKMLSIPVLSLLFLSASSARFLYGSDLCPESSSYQSYSNSNDYNSNTDDAYRQNQWSPDYRTTLPSCDSAEENAHGLYTSNLAPCEISFHKSNDTADEDSYQLLSPEACTDQNRVALSGSKAKTLLQYVYNWKDECVGNFIRCYSLAANKDIYQNLVCRKKWKIPTGATHMSVNCTKDKQLKEAAIAEYKDLNNNNNYNSENDPVFAMQEKQMKANSKRWHEMEAIMATILAVLVLCCFGFSVAVYWCMIKPYMTDSNAANKRSEIEDLMLNTSESKLTSINGGKMYQAEVA